MDWGMKVGSDFGLVEPRPSEFVTSEELSETARKYKGELLARMFRAPALLVEGEPTESAVPADSNVVGVGFGAKVTGESEVSEGFAVRVYVRVKFPAAALGSRDVVPPEVNGVPTDVVEAGDVTALARPTMCGVSGGHFAIPAGTLGCLVRKREGSGEHYILSNNHVLANANVASLGDAILEPGAQDGGDRHNPIGELVEFEPLRFRRVFFPKSNSIDAAIARVLNLGDVMPDILGGIGRVQHPATLAAINQSVAKYGKTTSLTSGVIRDVNADINYRYHTRHGIKKALFKNQIQIDGVGGQFSKRGDSGALIVDAESNQPVALLAAGDLVTFANHLVPVLDRFDIEVV